MEIRDTQTGNNFFVIGISYEKADTETRGKYTFFPENVELLVNEASHFGVSNGFVVSTCNRSEFYGFANSAEDLVALYCNYTEGSEAQILPYVQIKEGKEAIEHLFRVSCGLESQILGDFDIIGQIKTWFKRFKQHHFTNAFLERLINTSIQVSKKIKNETHLSNGAASVSFAAVQFIQQLNQTNNPKILLFGIGKIGRNTCSNLVKHLPDAQITLINRTFEKASHLQAKFPVEVKEFSQLEDELKQTDVLIVATGSQQPTITENMIPLDKGMTILDLSVPENVMHTLGTRENINLINVDALSKTIDQTIAQRKADIPKAEYIIESCAEEFYEWIASREFVPVIQSFRERLEFLQQFELHNIKKEATNIDENVSILADKLVQKLTNQFASYILENKQDADESIALIQKMFHLKESAN